MTQGFYEMLQLLKKMLRNADISILYQNLAEVNQGLTSGPAVVCGPWTMDLFFYLLATFDTILNV